ncbi:MAG: sulfatase [Chloroflexi bacterium]|nr:sulfatase [Chloroflexota bacterium]
MPKPNILYIHSHDTGRYLQPYGHAIPTPNLHRLAEGGVLFRRAYCAAPTCSPSRAALLTGQAAHSAGMLGLANRGFVLGDFRQHIIHTLKGAGYKAALAGIQHLTSPQFHRGAEAVGYDHILTTERDQAHTAAVDFIRSAPAEPFWLTVGFFETHREFPLEHDVNPAYVQPPALFPDTPGIRQDMANYIAMAQILDDKIGQVLQALDETGQRENTLVIYTTDHGLAFPDMKCNLTDHGIGVALIMQGADPFAGGRTVDAMISQIDIFPTVCDLLDIEPPDWLQGHSMLPLLRGEADAIRDEVFAEVNYHAAYEPKRAVRSERYKYIRRYDQREAPVLSNIDDGFSKSELVSAGFGDIAPAPEQLYDTLLDPIERDNLTDDPEYADILADMRERLDRWMRETDDPLLRGHVPAQPGTFANDPDGTSPRGPQYPLNNEDGAANLKLP